MLFFLPISNLEVLNFELVQLNSRFSILSEDFSCSIEFQVFGSRIQTWASCFANLLSISFEFSDYWFAHCLCLLAMVHGIVAPVSICSVPLFSFLGVGFLFHTGN